MILKVVKTMVLDFLIFLWNFLKIIVAVLFGLVGAALAAMIMASPIAYITVHYPNEFFFYMTIILIGVISYFIISGLFFFGKEYIKNLIKRLKE